MDAQNFFHSMKDAMTAVRFFWLKRSTIGNTDIARFSVKALTTTLFLCVVVSVSPLWAATYKTKNFTVHANDSNFARQVGDAAEEYRVNLAITWLGASLPRWSRPCVVTVKEDANLVAGGETVFSFSNGEVYDWKMRVQGSRERILDSVLPHEVTHTIIASYLRSPAPRWLDEGMATAVEAEVERSRYRTMLATFLHTKRGIAFNDMVSMKEYPQDLTPFYSQSFSVCEYLINVGGYQRLAEFAKDGNKTKNWNAALKKHYDCDSLGALQVEWLEWVRQWDLAGQPRSLPETRKLPEFFGHNETTLASNNDSTQIFGTIEDPGRENQHINSLIIARGQNKDSERSGFFQNLPRPFASRENNDATEIQENETTVRAGSVVSNASQQDVSSLTMSNGTVWGSSGNVLANGAGSASKSGVVVSAMPYSYDQSSQNSAHSNSSGWGRQ